MKSLITNLLLLLLLSLINIPNSYAREQSSERIDIIVGLSVRPPFLEVPHHGAGPDILVALNKVQDKYNFTYQAIPSKRKVQAINEGWIDISMWDNVLWGWEKGTMQASVPLIDSKDVYIALAEKGRSQDFFDELTQRKLAFVSGYHYKIANFETNIDKLSSRFNLSIVQNEESAIYMVLAKRVEISIVSKTALDWFLIQNPVYQAKIIVSKTFDTQYSRHILATNNSLIEVSEVNHFLALADNKGLLAPIYKKYGLVKPTFSH